jgi:spore coat protein U-like protein
MKKILISALVVLGLTSTAFAAGTNQLTVQASVVGTCKFSTATATLDFGALDPNLATDATTSQSIDFWCTKGATATLASDNGIHASGTQKRMQHATVTTEFINYALNLTASNLVGAGKTTPRTLTVAGTILNADYVNAQAGSYADTVTINITP